MSSNQSLFRLKGSVASVGLLTLVLAATGCGQKSSGGSFSAPPIAPIVNAALPASLRAASDSASFRTNQEKAAPLGGIHPLSINPLTITPSNSPSGETSVATQAIKGMFTEYYGNPNSGIWYQGWLNNLVLAVDERMSGISSQISGLGTPPTCLSNSASSASFNLSLIDPMLNFTSPYLQCISTFGANGNTGPGAGDAFGSSGSNYSLWLYLVWNGSGSTYDQLGGFFAAANVINYGSTSTSTPETVDGVMIAYAPTTNPNPELTISRFTASPTTNSFALFVGSNQPTTSGGSSPTNTDYVGDSNLGSGVRILSDGQHVYADGLLLDPSASPNANGSYYNFNICLNASDLSLDGSPADCDTLANSYVTATWGSLYGSLGNPNPLATTATLNFNEVTGCAATLPSGTTALAATSPSTDACASGSAIPNPSTKADQTAPSAAILSALSTIGLPSNIPHM